MDKQPVQPDSPGTVLTGLKAKAPRTQQAPFTYVEVRDDYRIDTTRAEHIGQVTETFEIDSFDLTEIHYFRGETGALFSIRRSHKYFPLSRTYWSALFSQGTLGDYFMTLCFLLPPFNFFLFGAAIKYLNKYSTGLNEDATVFESEYDLAVHLKDVGANEAIAGRCLGFDQHFMIDDWDIHYNQTEGFYVLYKDRVVHEVLSRNDFPDWLEVNAPYALREYTDRGLPDPL